MNTLNELMQREYSTIVAADQATDGRTLYVAYHPDLEGCMSDGETPAEAIENLKDARRLYFQTLLEMHLPIPESKVINTTIEGQSVAGQLIHNL